MYNNLRLTHISTQSFINKCEQFIILFHSLYYSRCVIITDMYNKMTDKLTALLENLFCDDNLLKETVGLTRINHV